MFVDINVFNKLDSLADYLRNEIPNDQLDDFNDLYPENTRFLDNILSGTGLPPQNLQEKASRAITHKIKYLVETCCLRVEYDPELPVPVYEAIFNHSELLEMGNSNLVYYMELGTRVHPENANMRYNAGIAYMHLMMDILEHATLIPDEEERVYEVEKLSYKIEVHFARAKQLRPGHYKTIPVMLKQAKQFRESAVLDAERLAKGVIPEIDLTGFFIFPVAIF